MSKLTDKVAETLAMRRRGTGPSIGTALSATIYTAPPDPKRCAACGKEGSKLAAILRGAWECSACECPMRRLLTASPGAKAPGEEEL